MTIAFVGSYGPADEPGIHVVDVSPGGQITRVAAQSGVTNPSFLALDPERRFLFVVSETGVGGDGVVGHVYSFRIDRAAAGVRLFELGHWSTGGDYPCHVAVDRSGRWLAVSNYGSGSVSVLPVASDGTCDDLVSHLQHSGSGPRPDRQAGPHAHSAVFSPTNRFLVVADLGIDRLITYRFSDRTGTCELASSTPTNPGAGPRHMAFHPDGAHLFVANELDNTLGRYWFQEGTLQLIDVVSTVPSDITETLAADVHVDCSGGSVYVSNRGHDSIAVFDADRELRGRAIVDAGGEWPRGFAIAPDGTGLVVALRRSDVIVALPLVGGEPGAPNGRLGIREPSCVVFG